MSIRIAQNNTNLRDSGDRNYSLELQNEPIVVICRLSGIYNYKIINFFHHSDSTMNIVFVFTPEFNFQ